MKSEREKKVFRVKVVAAAALLVLFAGVVFSMPAERLAWQAPHVIGTLLLPRPAPGPYVRPDAMRDDAYSTFSLLAFFSVLGILGLAARTLYPKLPGAGRKRAGPSIRRPAGDEAATGRDP